MPWRGVCSSVLIRAMVSAQPEPIPSPKVESGHQLESTSPRTSPIRQTLKKYKQKVTTKEGWLGDYNYAWYGSIQSFSTSSIHSSKINIFRLCTPSLPCLYRNDKRQPPFYALNQELPLLLAITCGLQHALAMLAGLITPPIIFASALNLDNATSAYLISASLIGCGMCA